MIQFYDDRPDDPIAAFIYFETVFRWRFISEPSPETRFEYVCRLLTAARELGLSILPDWEIQSGREHLVAELKNEKLLRLHGEFNEAMFSRFQQDVRSILPTLNELCRGEALYDPHSTYCWYQPALRGLIEATPEL